MKYRFTLAPLLVFYVALVGCGSSGSTGIADDHPAGVPSPLMVELRTTEPDAIRYAYHRVDPDGTMYFAGGRDAVADKSRAIGRTTPAERTGLWEIIEKHNLLAAKGEFLPLGDGAVTYKMKLQAGDQSRSISTRAAGQTGLAELSDALNEIRARLRTAAVMAPIRSELDSDSENMKRQRE